MQGLEFVVIVLLLLGCQPRKKTTIIEEEPAALSAEQVPVNKTCQAVRTPARQLSKTGCVEALDPKVPAVGLVAYDIVAPLWSDGSQKQRYLAVPEGKKAQITASGHIDLPIGSVAMKTFSLSGKPIETRLFMRESETRWRGYSYEWRADGSDADLLEDGMEKVIGDQTWVYPSPKQCDTCHNKVSEITLGLSAIQLLPVLADLQKAGILTYEESQLPQPALVDYMDKSEPIEARARSYLQGNCANCHQPNGGGIGDFDFRIQNDFQQIGFCNKTPLIDVFPVTEGKVFKPGVPNESILILRMMDPSDFHMPPMVSRVVDKAGVDLMKDWVLLRSSCETL